jgi:hypothetical protein
MYKHSAKFERSVLKTVGELAIAAQTMYCNGVCDDFSVLKKPPIYWKILVIPVLQILEDSGK